jgi:hypothetical protein
MEKKKKSFPTRTRLMMKKFPRPRSKAWLIEKVCFFLFLGDNSFHSRMALRFDNFEACVCERESLTHRDTDRDRERERKRQRRQRGESFVFLM